MKKIIVLIALITTVSFSYGQEKANHNTTRSNKATGVMFKGEDPVQINLKAINGRLNERVASNSIKNSLKRKGVDLSENEINKITMKTAQAVEIVGGSNGKEEVAGISIEITWTTKKGRKITIRVEF